jgi:hypothetical protein
MPRRSPRTSLPIVLLGCLAHGLCPSSAPAQTVPAASGPQGAIDAIGEALEASPIAIDGRGQAVFDVPACATTLRTAVERGASSDGGWHFVGFARLATGERVATLTDADGRLWSVAIGADDDRCVVTPSLSGHVVDAASWEVVLPPVELERIGPVELP